MAQCRPVKPSEQLAASSRYELVLRLAAGGMGSVFLGIDREDPSTLRAIKRAHAHLMKDASFRKMFVREARLALRIDTPNAVGVIDVDDSDGELLMVMRYVEGPSLAGFLEATKHDPVELRRWALLRVIVDAARGLDAAHALRDEAGSPLGLVHRDVSPHNILVSVTGVASIVDFGIAKAMSEVEVTSTATNMVKGKFAYMAPEYLRNRIAGPRSDVFSLGVVAWEALTSLPLFRTDNDADTASNLLSADEARPLDTVAVGFDPGVVEVIARALKKKPEERFSTAGDFADALEAAARSAASFAEQSELAAMVRRVFGAELDARRAMVATALLAREAQKAAEAMVPAHSVLRMSSRPPPGLDLGSPRDLSTAKTTVRMGAPVLEPMAPRPAVDSLVAEEESTLDAPSHLKHPPEPKREAPAPEAGLGGVMAIGVAIAVVLLLGGYGAYRFVTYQEISQPATDDVPTTVVDAHASVETPKPAPAPEESATTLEAASIDSAALATAVSAMPSASTAASTSAAPGASAAPSAPPTPRPSPRPRPQPPSAKYNPQGI